KFGNERQLQHTHEPGEHDQVRAARDDRGDVMCLSIAIELRLVRRRVEEVRRHTKPRAQRKNPRVRLVGINLHDLRPPQFAGLLRHENGLGIRAATGTENDDAHGYSKSIATIRMERSASSTQNVTVHPWTDLR